MSVTLNTTHGPLKLELFLSSCPKTCENFLALAASGKYNDTLFHRNIKGFMLQGGDPSNTGKGGISIYGGKFADEIRTSLKFNTRGIVAMASSGPNTNQSQFFITYTSLPHLDGKYTIFAKIIHGAEDGGTLDIIEGLPVTEKGKPLNSGNECRIKDVVIHANPIAQQARQ
ncbi:unnamed protein product [Sympodiomycopsis kandeliae]